jgi:hypothetical protein
MYPKRFTFDPLLVERAKIVTLQSPDLNVLRDENRDEMPNIARFLEGGFKARDKDGKLLLPDLSALLNSIVGIFSDYGGEHNSSRYYTYSFLTCAFGSLDPFKQQMDALRKRSSLGTKEIAFKSFRHGPMYRAIPDYLRIVDSYINGIIFTLAVEKDISSLFGPGGPETSNSMLTALEQRGFGRVALHIGEKLFRVLHCVAFLVALLGHPGQKIFWMTDHDAIGETSERHKSLLDMLNSVLPLYTDKPFSFLGGARPFGPRAFEYLDLLSIADIAAGTIAQVLSSIDKLGKENAQIKEGGEQVLRWLCHNSVTLKKFTMVVKRLPNGEVGFGPVDLEARVPVEGELFIPTQLLR